MKAGLLAPLSVGIVEEGALRELFGPDRAPFLDEGGHAVVVGPVLAQQAGAAFGLGKLHAALNEGPEAFDGQD